MEEMYTIKVLQEQKTAKKNRLRRLELIDKEIGVFAKVKYLLKTNWWLCLLTVINFSLDIFPLYTMLELATSDNVFFLAFLTISIPAILTAGSFLAGQQETKAQQNFVLFAACTPQIFIIVTRFVMKNQLFPISENNGIQNVMDVNQTTSSWFDGSTSLVLLLTCCAILASYLLAKSSKKEKESLGFEKMVAKKRLNAILENLIEVETLIDHQEEVVRDYEGVIPEAIKIENNRYDEIYKYLQNSLESYCKLVRLNLAEHLGDPASMKYLTQQQPLIKDKIPEFKIPPLLEEEYKIEEYVRKGRPYYEKQSN